MKTRAQKALESNRPACLRYGDVETAVYFEAILEAIAADAADFERRLHGPFLSAFGYRTGHSAESVCPRPCYILEAEPEETEGE